MVPLNSERGSPKETSPEGPSAPAGVMNRIGGAAAWVHSQLRLESWEQKVSDRWVLATVPRGYRLLIGGGPHLFPGSV